MPRRVRSEGHSFCVCLASLIFAEEARVLVTRVLGAGAGVPFVARSLLRIGLDGSSKQTDVETQRIADAVKDPDAGALNKLFPTAAREMATRLDSWLEYFLSVLYFAEFTADTGHSDYLGIYALGLESYTTHPFIPSWRRSCSTRGSAV
jgi:hypothetical protein